MKNKTKAKIKMGLLILIFIVSAFLLSICYQTINIVVEHFQAI